MSDVITSNRLLTTFVVDGLHLGVDALEVQEVLRHQPMTQVPLAPAGLALFTASTNAMMF